MDSIPLGDHVRTKRCTACGVEQHISHFRPGKRYTGGIRSQCRKCERARAKIREAKAGDGPTKQCAACLQTKPIADFYKRYGTARRNTCVSCERRVRKARYDQRRDRLRADATRRYAANRDAICAERRAKNAPRVAQAEEEKRRRREATEKACRQCGIVQPLAAFNRHDETVDGHSNVCRACIKAYNRERYPLVRARNAERPDIVKAWDRAYYRRNSERIRARVKNYYEAAKHTAAFRLRARRGKLRRRTRELHCEGSHTPQQFRDLCKHYGYICLCCGEEKPLTEDHVVPLSKGGTDYIDNIEPLCRSCSCAKGARIVDFRLCASRLQSPQP